MNGYNNNFNEFPYKFQQLNDEINKQLLEDFQGKKEPFIQIGPKKYCFSGDYMKEAHNYYNFEARPQDIWIVTFPRSGTTWTQEMVWLLANDLDYEKAATTSLAERFPFLEFSNCVHPILKKQFLEENKYDEDKIKRIEKLCTPAWKTLNAVPGNCRRFIKTHLPFSLLSPNLLESGCKIIYVARNPKDVAVSYYHLNRLFKTQGFCGDFPKFWNYFENNLVLWAPYWSHINEGWERRNKENVLFLFYESLNKDLIGNLKRMSDFLGKSYTMAQLEKLENHLKIDNFRNNKSVNFDDLKELGITNNESGFVRNGKSGGWRDYFKGDLNDKADKWIKENLKNTDLQFPYFL